MPDPSPRPLREYHVFLASPGDMNAERQAVREFFDEYNRARAHHLGIQFQVVDYENFSSAGVGRPQELINHQTLARFEDSLVLIIGLMGQRFGLPTGVFESGTEEEFEVALEHRLRTGWPEVKCFFRRIQRFEAPSDPEAIERAAQQWRQVLAFRRRLEEPSPRQVYVKDFDGDGSVLTDDCFYNVPMADVLERVVPIIRRTRPQVLVTYDERGGYPHPDHIRTHTATMAAWRAAADPSFMPEAGPAWRASKVYYQMTFTYRRLTMLQAECEVRGIESPFREWIDGWDTSRAERITTSIDVGEYVGLRGQALRAHRTQVDPTGNWFKVPDDLVAEIYPWEDFRLAHSEVATDKPEDDLFAGLSVTRP